jgi:hypothetical protein
MWFDGDELWRNDRSVCSCNKGLKDSVKWAGDVGEISSIYRIFPLNTPQLAAGMKAGCFPSLGRGN